MADKPFPKGTGIRFKGSQYGVTQPIGEITGYDAETGYYQCVFYVQRRPWRPELLPTEFTVLKKGEQ